MDEDCNKRVGTLALACLMILALLSLTSDPSYRKRTRCQQHSDTPSGVPAPYSRRISATHVSDLISPRSPNSSAVCDSESRRERFRLCVTGNIRTGWSYNKYAVKRYHRRLTEDDTTCPEEGMPQANRSALGSFIIKKESDPPVELRASPSHTDAVSSEEDNSKSYCYSQTGTRPSSEKNSQRITRPEKAYFDNKKQQQQNNHKKSFSGCACQCRMSDRAKSGRFTSKPCRFQQKAATTLIPTLSVPGPSPSSDRTRYSGRRCRRIFSKSWAVDTTPNRRGQAKRNDMKCDDVKVDLLGTKPSNAHGPRYKGVLSLLLMSEEQRKVGERSGHGNIISRYLVHLAVLVVLLGHLCKQKSTTLSLLRSFGSYNRTVKIDMNENKLLSAVKDFFYYQALENDSFPLQDLFCVYKTPSPILDPKLKARMSHQQRLVWAYPATGFLPDVTARDSNFLDHLGCRLASLAALPSSCSLSRVRLADAGFHYNPRANPSAVACHRCGATLSLDADPQDTARTSPLEFHRLSSPDCGFLRSVLEQYTEMPSASASAESPTPSSAGLPLTSMSATHRLTGATDHTDGRDLSEDGEGAAQAPGNNGQTFTASQPSRPSAPSNRQVRDTSSRQVRDTSSRQVRDRGEERPQLDLGSAVYPQFSTAQSRLVTFTNWPLVNVFLPQTLASQGFYYAGYSDCLRCFYCGVGLKSWAEQDDPQVEHARWRPGCGFLLATKGRRYVQSVLNAIANTGSQEDNPQPQPTTIARPELHQTANSSNTRLTTVSDGQVSRTVPERTPQSLVRQQLLTMGFSSEQIDRAQAELRSSGEAEVLDNLLVRLIPE